MEQFTKGRYSGAVISVHDDQGILSSRTSYNRHQFNDRLHYHDNMHISLVVRGGCLEKKKDSYQRLPGTLTFYAAGEPHQVLRVADSSIHFNMEIESQFLRRFDITEQALSIAVQGNPDAKFLLLKMQHALLAGGPGAITSVRMLLLDFMAGAETHPRTKPAWLSRVEELLRENWDGSPNLDELATAAGVHPVTVSRYFHRYLGCTLSEYLRKLKVEHALAILAECNTSFADVAYRCGFADQSHFIRTFKQQTGFLPAKLAQLVRV